jgi:multidrug efflux system outer membrane protein
MKNTPILYNTLLSLLNQSLWRDKHHQSTIEGARYARLARLRYDGGYTSYLEVLDTEHSL